MANKNANKSPNIADIELFNNCANAQWYNNNCQWFFNMEALANNNTIQSYHIHSDKAYT